jgi:hypothetical protein
MYPSLDFSVNPSASIYGLSELDAVKVSADILGATSTTDISLTSPLTATPGIGISADSFSAVSYVQTPNVSMPGLAPNIVSTDVSNPPMKLIAAGNVQVHSDITNLGQLTASILSTDKLIGNSGGVDMGGNDLSGISALTCDTIEAVSGATVSSLNLSAGAPSIVATAATLTAPLNLHCSTGVLVTTDGTTAGTLTAGTLNGALVAAPVVKVQSQAPATTYTYLEWDNSGNHLTSQPNGVVVDTQTIAYLSDIPAISGGAAAASNDLDMGGYNITNVAQLTIGTLQVPNTQFGTTTTDLTGLSTITLGAPFASALYSISITPLDAIATTIIPSAGNRSTTGFDLHGDPNTDYMWTAVGFV